MEKLILLWLPLQGDVQCRHISPESYIVIICKLISTCDLMRRGFSLGRPGRRCSGPPWGKLLYHCTVWQASYKWRLNPDTYCLFELFTYTQTKIITWQTCRLPRGVPEVHDIVLPIYGQQQTNHSAWLAQNNLDWSSRRGEICLKNGFKYLNYLLYLLGQYFEAFFSAQVCQGVNSG